MRNPPQSHTESIHHTDRFENLTPVGKRTDPWACYYADPSNHFNLDGQKIGTACICSYCRDGLDCCPIFSRNSLINRLPCGHDADHNFVICACVKFRREPISDDKIEAMLAVEREDPYYTGSRADMEC